eukprot:CAMPEP_0179314398 /NCGR_PEP_ID=MMETSP0797-20121207/54427_1 /TAXON_ID=47934 /ORGANISM="Dinophysis acuminata, Strain DAEP01" /LENGTH=163 /DNA_ID=CAMNT_0021024693 /DNA_START=59 /DNA_END=551 /DNA_ORIENTATION=-
MQLSSIRMSRSFEVQLRFSSGRVDPLPVDEDSREHPPTAVALHHLVLQLPPVRRNVASPESLLARSGRPLGAHAARASAAADWDSRYALRERMASFSAFSISSMRISSVWTSLIGALGSIPRGYDSNCCPRTVGWTGRKDPWLWLRCMAMALLSLHVQPSEKT